MGVAALNAEDGYSHPAVSSPSALEPPSAFLLFSLSFPSHPSQDLEHKFFHCFAFLVFVFFPELIAVSLTNVEPDSEFQPVHQLVLSSWNPTLNLADLPGTSMSPFTWYRMFPRHRLFLWWSPLCISHPGGPRLPRLVQLATSAPLGDQLPTSPGTLLLVDPSYLTFPVFLVPLQNVRDIFN